MENNIQSMIDEAIEDAINQLNRLEKGSPEYNQMVTNIAKLNEQRLKEAELDATANSKAMERAIEAEKGLSRKRLRMKRRVRRGSRPMWIWGRAYCPSWVLSG